MVAPSPRSPPRNSATPSGPRGYNTWLTCGKPAAGARLRNALALEYPAQRAAARVVEDMGHGPPERLALTEDWAAAYRLMERLDLLHLIRPRDAVRFTSDPSESELSAFSELACLTHWRARCRNASAGPLLTALRRVADFKAAYPSVELWSRLLHGADWEQAAYNERVFAWLQDFCRDTRKRGSGVCRADTVSGYISTLRAALSLEAEQRLLLPATHIIQSAAAKHMRSEDGEAAERGLRAGFRAYQQRAILTSAQTALDIHSPYGMWAWDTATRNRITMRRGGENGVTDNPKSLSGQWDPAGSAGSRWMHVHFFPVGHSLVGPAPFLIDWVLPLKKGKSKRYPMLVSARPRLRDGSADPLCPFAAYVRPWLLKHGGTCLCDPGRFMAALVGADPETNAQLASQHDSSPFRRSCIFEMPDGRVPRTADILQMFRKLARAAGLDPSLFGSNAGRISGAEDIYDFCLAQEGVSHAIAKEQGMRLIQERGRWEDDIGFIYARPSAAAHLALSAHMGDHARVDIEALLAAMQIPSACAHQGPFAQPAWR